MKKRCEKCKPKKFIYKVDGTVLEEPESCDVTTKTIKRTSAFKVLIEKLLGK